MELPHKVQALLLGLSVQQLEVSPTCALVGVGVDGGVMTLYQAHEDKRPKISDIENAAKRF